MDLYEQIKLINEQSLTEEGTRLLIADLSESEVVAKAIGYGAIGHMFQVRKYLGVPYITHPVAVASIAKLVGASVNQQAAGVLHDTVEDVNPIGDTPGIIQDDITEVFGEDISALVEMLTDVSVEYKGQDGYNRKVRKEMDRLHSAQASPEGQTMKLADLIHNSFSIVQFDPNFARLYLSEKILLLDVLTAGDKGLHEVAVRVAAEGLYTLEGAAKSASAFVEVRDD